LIASATIATPVHALVNIIGQETAGNVQFSYSGSLDVTGLSRVSTTPINGIATFLAFFSFNGASSSADLFLSAISGPRSFGSGGFTSSSSSSGNTLLFRGDFGILALPDGYVSGTSISGLATFNSATFDSLGVTPGTYDYSLTNGLDSIALDIGVTPVPFEFYPALGLGVLGGLVAAKKLSGKFFKK
jgi:hypothetical protein